MTLFMGTCSGGPWNGEIIKSQANFVHVPIRTTALILKPLKMFPKFIAGDQGIYQWVDVPNASPVWRWGANPNA